MNRHVPILDRKISMETFLFGLKQICVCRSEVEAFFHLQR